MPEYFVHILNWPVTANNPEEAAKGMYADIGCNAHPYFTVTEEEAVLELKSYRGQDDHRYISSWIFDAEDWYDKEEEEEIE